MKLAKSGYKTVLVIDDEVLIHRVLERAAAANGFEVIHAMTGEEGVLLASDKQPDLILLDLGLPDMDGSRVLGCLKSVPRTVSIPVMIYSGRTEHDERIASFRFGADDFIEKPFEIDMLVRRMQHLIFKAAESAPKSGTMAVASASPEYRAKRA